MSKITIMELSGRLQVEFLNGRLAKLLKDYRVESPASSLFRRASKPILHHRLRACGDCFPPLGAA